MNAPAALLSVQDLAVSAVRAGADLPLVAGVDLEMAVGETVCLVGESGCGKSLTALAIPRLLPAGLRLAAERMDWRGEDLLGFSARKLRALRGAQIGFVFQEPMSSMNPVLSVGTQVVETLRAHERISRAEARERAVGLLTEVGLPGAAGRLGSYPHELSGGLRQRVMLAMALACNPALLIADEPTTALDVSIQAQILDLLARERQARGLALLLITHDLGVVAELGQRVLVMYAGQVVESARVDELFATPLHPYTRALLASLPRIDRRCEEGGIPGRVPLPGKAPSGCRFRDRCTLAAPECAEPQVLRRLDSGRALRCCRAEASA